MGKNFKEAGSEKIAAANEPYMAYMSTPSEPPAVMDEELKMIEEDIELRLKPREKRSEHVQLLLTKRLFKELTVTAASYNISRNDLINTLLEDGLKRLAGKER